MLQKSRNQTPTDKIGRTQLEERQQLPSQPATTADLLEVEPANLIAAIDRLEETILKSPRVPLTGKTCVDEDVLLDQIDRLRLSLPAVVTTAREILTYKQQIITAAQQQVQQTLAVAQQQADDIANELRIVERAEQEARQIRQIAIVECEQLRYQTAIEIEEHRQRNLQELAQLQQEVRGECEQMQIGADEYADRILHNMEYQLKDVLQSIQRGRQRLNQDAAATREQAYSAAEPEVSGLSHKLQQIAQSVQNAKAEQLPHTKVSSANGKHPAGKDRR